MGRQADHTIRLRGPWRYFVIAHSALCERAPEEQSQHEKHSPIGTIHIPMDWGTTLGRNFRGRVRYSRSFGKPTGLNAEDRVELVCQCVDAFGAVELNDLQLGNIPSGLAATRFDITQFLRPRNELVIDVELPMAGGDLEHSNRPGREGLPGGIVGEVCLEIFTGEPH
jgi:hypothetical protein